MIAKDWSDPAFTTTTPAGLIVPPVLHDESIVWVGPLAVSRFTR